VIEETPTTSSTPALKDDSVQTSYPKEWKIFHPRDCLKRGGRETRKNPWNASEEIF